MPTGAYALVAASHLPGPGTKWLPAGGRRPVNLCPNPRTMTHPPHQPLKQKTAQVRRVFHVNQLRPISVPSHTTTHEPPMPTPADRVFLSLPNEGTSLDAAGDLLLRLPAAATGGAYSLMELTLAPGQGAPLHVHHREDEIFYVLTGQCDIIDQLGHRTALPGSVAVFTKGTPHAFRATGSEPCRVAITAIPGGLEHFFIALNQAVSTGTATPARVAEISREFEIDFLPASPP